MIVGMRHLDLVTVASAQEATLVALRELGAVHLDLGAAQGEAIAGASEAMVKAERAVRLVLAARGKRKRDDFALRSRKVDEVLAIEEERGTLTEEAARLAKEIKLYAPYGDFDPQLAKKVLTSLSAHGLEDAAQAVITLPEKLPEMRLSAMQERLTGLENRIRIGNEKLSAVDEQLIIAKYPMLQDKLRFEQARMLLAAQGEVAVISGWIPEPKLGDLSAAAKKNGWGLLVREPIAGEEPPTLIEPPRFFKSVRALFAGLGIAPGYNEGDVSVAFMAYFSLFFAMLVGDGAYGLIFLTVTIAFRKKLPKAWVTLLTVFSLGTIGWGLLSNTWFGASIPWCANWPTVKWLADPSYQHMMLLCFTIGVSHLVLARAWNGFLKINSLECLPEFGWTGVLIFMYLVTNSVVGIFSGIPTWGYWVFGVGLAMIVSRTRGADLGMLPLNVMGALGDIISYVRLFAVGLASVKVAENFNSMAIGLLDGASEWYQKALMAVVMVAILVMGHALNLAMAGLSILVHAVRLNTLEFSNHKGISWAGYAYQAFKKGEKTK